MLGGILPGWKVFWNLVGVAAFILLAIFVYTEFFAPPPDITSAEEISFDQINPKITKDAFEFAHAETNESDLRGFVVAAIKGDTPNERFKYEITKAVGNAEGVTLKQAPMSARFKSFFLETKDVTEQLNQSRAAKYIEDTPGVDFVVFGDVKTKNFPENKQAQIELNLVFQSADKNYMGTYKAVSWDDPSDREPGFFSNIGGFLWRLLLFVAVAFSIPVVSYPINVGLMRFDSNALNGFMLVFYTLLTGFLVFVLAGFTFTGWSITLAVLGMIAAAFWNFRVLSLTADYARS